MNCKKTQHSMEIFIPKEKFKVLVRCYTYNHAPYIEDSLKGFSMQETDFPYVCVVVDDASTDGEREVIVSFLDNNCVGGYNVMDLDYSELILATHKDNSNCHFAVYLLKENQYRQKNKKKALVDPWREVCVYEATCEGDDYWTDSQKLQKQVDFLEGHPDYSFSCTGFDFLNQSTNGILSGGDVINANVSIINANSDISLSILDGTLFRIQPMTVVYRLSSYEKIAPFLDKQRGLFLMGDTQTWIYLLQVGKLHYLPDNTAVYRMNEGSACRQKTMKKRVRFDLSIAEMRVYMADKINAPQEYKVKFQKSYQKKLNIYYCYDKDYRPFVEIKFYSVKDKIQYYVLKSFIARPFFKMVYERHYRKLLSQNEAFL